VQRACVTLGLTKTLGGRRVIDDLSMTVPRRSIYGFLGANGAGKTTTIRILLGLLKPDSGSISLFGQPMRRGTSRHIGALVESPALYDHLTGIENLALTCRILDVPRAAIGPALELVDLERAGDQRVGTYSLGMRQRLGIARALLGSPPLLILDEPTNGLDPDGIRDMRALLRRLPETGDITLIVSSHLLSEIEQIASHVGLLHHGRLLAEAPLAELLGSDSVEVVTDDAARAVATLATAGIAARPHDDRPGTLIANTADAAGVAHLLHQNGARLWHLARHRRSLEQVYQNLRVRTAA
jgi:ABC-type multidrug transport system ATPase subunit